MQDTLKDKIKTYTVTGLVVLCFGSGLNTLCQNSASISRLENSNYTWSYTDASTGKLYGYDDNNDGNIDRIEEAGIIPFKTGLPAFRIEKTHMPTDPNYSWYLERLKSLGTKKK